MTRYRQLSDQAGADITPQLMQSSNRVKELRDKYVNQGGNFDDFISTLNR